VGYHDGDVIVTASLLCQLDERCARPFDLVAPESSQYTDNFGVVDQIREPVRAKQKLIRYSNVLQLADIDNHLRVHAKRAGYSVRIGMILCLAWGQDTGHDQIVNHRMIVRELLNCSVPQQVGAGITCMTNGDTRCGEQQSNARTAGTKLGFFAACQRMNGSTCGLNELAQIACVSRCWHRSFKQAFEHLCRRGASYAASFVTAHPVADDQKRCVWSSRR
jgi:hypothetical protein